MGILYKKAQVLEPVGRSHAKDQTADRMILFLVLGFWVNYAGAMLCYTPGFSDPTMI